MPYLIDGHNLIAALPDIDLSDPDDEAKLVLRLKGFVARSRRRCTVIFDGGIPGGASTLGNKAVSVIFAASHRDNADRLLKLRIRRFRDPRNWTVVSSDQAVLDCARTHKTRWLTAAEFAEKLAAEPDEGPAPGEEVETSLSPAEVDEWLAIFGDG